jgi:hypothetical protein
VFRAALFSIVVSLATGQDVALLCRTWCDAETAAATECHHKDSSPTPNVAGDKDCDPMMAVAVAVKEDVRRGDVSPDGNPPILVRPYQLTHLTIEARRGQEPWRESSLDTRPLSTTLRI